MKNFVYCNPTKILFGDRTVEQIGNESRQFGTKALLVYGRNSIRTSGLHEKIMLLMKEARIAVVEHGGVRSNPVLSHVRQGIEKAKLNSVEVIVAVGGGSVLDSAKAIAAGSLADHDVWQFFRGKKGVKNSLPLTCVVTLAASGSEMNGGMVVTNEQTRQKFGIANRLLFPKVSILDPTLTYSVPSAYTAYGAIDAMAHILEFYLSAEEKDAQLQDRLMEGLLCSIMASCDKVLSSPTEYKGRAQLMWCATLALNGIIGAGLGKVGFPMHMIEHSLSALYDVPHGAGLSVVVPAYMRYQAERNPRKMAELGRRLFSMQTGSDIDLAMRCISALQGWFSRIGAPVSLAELKIPAVDIPIIAENAMGLAKLWRIREMDEKTVSAILQSAA